MDAQHFHLSCNDELKATRDVDVAGVAWLCAIALLGYYDVVRFVE